MSWAVFLMRRHEDNNHRHRRQSLWGAPSTLAGNRTLAHWWWACRRNRLVSFLFCDSSEISRGLLEGYFFLFFFCACFQRGYRSGILLSTTVLLRFMKRWRMEHIILVSKPPRITTHGWERERVCVYIIICVVERGKEKSHLATITNLIWYRESVFIRKATHRLKLKSGHASVTKKECLSMGTSVIDHIYTCLR